MAQVRNRCSNSSDVAAMQRNSVSWTSKETRRPVSGFRFAQLPVGRGHERRRVKTRFDLCAYSGFLHQLFVSRFVFMNDREDAALVAESLRGNREAFESLVNDYQKPVYNMAYRLLNNCEDARDVTQNVFLKAFRNLEGFDPKYKFFSWICRIALNESINLRNSRRVPRGVDERVADGRPLPDDLLCCAELSSEIQSALMSMELDQRAVIVLRHFHHCSYQDIGQILDIPEKTVKSRLFTARNHLREVLCLRGVL